VRRAQHAVEDQAVPAGRAIGRSSQPRRSDAPQASTGSPLSKPKPARPPGAASRSTSIALGVSRGMSARAAGMARTIAAIHAAAAALPGRVIP